MYKPILYKATAFDADVGYTFTFRWDDTQTRFTKSVLTFSDNETGVAYCTSTYNSVKNQHILTPSTLTGTLANGRQYSVTLKLYNSSNVPVSLDSDPIIVYCFTTPTFEFNNLTDQQTITASSFQLSFTYTQLETSEDANILTERPKEFEVLLYDISEALVYDSGVRTSWISGSADGEYVATQEISGLTDNSIYRIVVKYSTQHGMLYTTAPLLFRVDYDSPSLFSLLSAENLPRRGYVHLSGHAIAIAGTGVEGHYQFIDDNSVSLDNTPNGYIEFANISYPQNFRIDILFERVNKTSEANVSTGISWSTDMVNNVSSHQYYNVIIDGAPIGTIDPDSYECVAQSDGTWQHTIDDESLSGNSYYVVYDMPIVSFSDGTYSGEVQYREAIFNEDDGLQGYVQLVLQTPLGEAFYMSEPIDVFNDEDVLHVWLVKYDNIYTIHCEKES